MAETHTINPGNPIAIVAPPIEGARSERATVADSSTIVVLNQASDVTLTRPPSLIPQVPLRDGCTPSQPSLPLSTHIQTEQDDSSSEALTQPEAECRSPSESDSISIPVPPGLTPPYPPPPPSSLIASVSEAVARFKPSPRDIISGIAPHVFDERRRRRTLSAGGRQGGRRSSSSPSRRYYHQCRPKASPLRRSVVVSWDDHSIYLGHGLDGDVYAKAGARSTRASVDVATGQLEQQHSQNLTDSGACSTTQKPSSILSVGCENTTGTVDMSMWRKFKLDNQLFRTLVSRMKRRNSSSTSKASH